MSASTFLVLHAMAPDLLSVTLGILVARLSYLAINDLIARVGARQNVSR